MFTFLTQQSVLKHLELLTQLCITVTSKALPLYLLQNMGYNYTLNCMAMSLTNIRTVENHFQTNHPFLKFPCWLQALISVLQQRNLVRYTFHQTTLLIKSVVFKDRTLKSNVLILQILLFSWLEFHPSRLIFKFS